MPDSVFDVSDSVVGVSFSLVDFEINKTQCPVVLLVF